MVELTFGGRVTNGCGDDIMRRGANVENGRLVVVEYADVVYAGVFVVVDALDSSNGDAV